MTGAGRVLVTDSGTLLAPAIERLREHEVDVTLLRGGDSTAKIAAGREADAVLVGVEALPGPELRAMAEGGRLRLVIRAGVGYDVVDIATAAELGIAVANVPDYCTDEVADHTLTLLLVAARRLPFFLSAPQHTWWPDLSRVSVPRLRGATLGLIGIGRIGSAVAARAAAFGLRVIATDPVAAMPTGVEGVSLTDLLARSDIVSVHCPYTPDTHHLLNEAAFQVMRRGALLINTARGPIVDSAALVRGLALGKPALAALDVLEDEPRPDLDQALLAHQRVIVTPHVAYLSSAAQRDLGLYAAENILGFLRGEPPRHVVNGVSPPAR